MADQCPIKWFNADEMVDAIAFPENEQRSMTIQEVKEMAWSDIMEQVEFECDIEVNGSFITDKFGVQSFIVSKFKDGIYGEAVMCVVGSYDVAKVVADRHEGAGVVQYASNGFVIVC